MFQDLRFGARMLLKSKGARSMLRSGATGPESESGGDIAG